jgi:parallel beta-helix repeat protein
MSRQPFWLLLALLLFLNAFLTFNSPSASSLAKSGLVQQGDSGVRNLSTGKSYATIQEAVDASETLNGHQILVSSGIYQESVILNKSVSLIGEAKDTTIIDGKGSSRAVYVTADNVEVKSFTIQNGTFGLWLHNSDNSKIIDNTLQDGAYGIRLLNSRNSLVVGNTIRRYSFFGVELDSSGNSTLRNNVIEDNRYNLGVDGKSLFDFTNDIDTSNTVNGKPVRYLKNQQDLTIDTSFPEIGYLGVVNSANIIVEDLDFQGNVQGVLFAFAKDSTVRNVNAKSNWNGIYVTHSTNISTTENNANQNFDYGIKFFNSSKSVASGNNVDNNGWGGIGIFGSPNSTIARNKASYNSYNLHVVFTNNSVITKNTSMKKAGGYSIAMYYSHNNHIYHNTLENTLLYVETRNGTRFTPANNWDNGLEGNYWTTYGGADANFDGVGDTPRAVGENNIDNHPLMGKFTETNLNVQDKTYSISIISNSTINELQYNPDDNSITLTALGRNGTQGFLRVAIPNTLLQDLQEESVGFLVNGELPMVKDHWTDETHMYFYLVYMNVAPEPMVSPWLIPALLVLTLILVLVLVFVVLRKKR